MRAATVAAVLGATYVGNLYQALNLLPNLAFELLTGSLFTMLLVPRLVRHVDSGDRAAMNQVAGSFLGLVVAAATLVVVALVAAGPLVLSVLTATVEDPVAGAAQRDVGWLLLLLLMPQVVLYAVAGTGAAVLNAHGRFALAAGAPVLENVGIIATFIVAALVVGTQDAVEDVGTATVLVLGVGTTASVGLHAAAVWWGAWRQGIRLVPRGGWHQGEVREVLRLLTPSLGFTGLNAAGFCAAIVVANSVPGGVVAFLLAWNFLNLPVAMGARPVATAFLPVLARLRHAGALDRFRDELVRAIGIALFLAIPAAVAYVVLAGPLARAISLGELANDRAGELVALALAGVALGVVGESLFVLATYASYALGDARSPVRSMFVKTAVLTPGLAVALLLSHDSAIVLTLGLALSIADLAAVLYLGRRLRRALPRGRVGIAGSALRSAAASLAMAGPAYLVAFAGAELVGNDAGVVAAIAAGATVFVLVQRRLRSPELAFLVGGLRSLRA